MAIRARAAASPWPLLALSTASVIAFIAVYAVFVRTSDGQRVDNAAMAGRAVAERGTEAAEHLLNTISVGSLVLAIVLLVVQALVRRRPGLSLVAAVVIIGSVLTAEVLKHSLARPEFVLGPLPAESFPSGHVAVAFSVGVAATLCVPVDLRRRTALLAVLYGSAIAVATVAAGWHRPSDTAGSLFLVIGFAAAIAALAPVDSRAPVGAPRASQWRDADRYLVAGVLALVVGWLVAIGVAGASQSGTIDWTLGSAAFLGACAAILGLASVLMAGLLWALGASR